MSKAKSKGIKKPKVYLIDGLTFKTKPMFDFYKELKELKSQGLVSSFALPTLEEMNAKSKYGAKKCEIDGEIFDSVMEGKFYVHLKEQMRNGAIKEIELHPKFALQDSFKKNGKTIRAITYISDFLVTYADDSKIVYDVKGRETADFKLKRKMFDCKYRDLTLKCVQHRVTGNRWIDIHDKPKKVKTKTKGAIAI